MRFSVKIIVNLQCNPLISTQQYPNENLDPLLLMTGVIVIVKRVANLKLETMAAISHFCSWSVPWTFSCGAKSCLKFPISNQILMFGKSTDRSRTASCGCSMLQTNACWRTAWSEPNCNTHYMKWRKYITTARFMLYGQIVCLFLLVFTQWYFVLCIRDAGLE